MSLVSWGRGFDEWLQTHGYQAVRILHADTPVCLSSESAIQRSPFSKTPGLPQNQYFTLIIFLSLIIIER